MVVFTRTTDFYADVGAAFMVAVTIATRSKSMIGIFIRIFI